MRIYVSSTSLDLKNHRRAVTRALQRAGHEPVCMEHHAAGDMVPTDECLREVTTCKAYVGIFAWRYGFIPPQHDASVTELEYREAERRKILTLIFLLDERAEWHAEYREVGAAGRRIQELRQELQQKKWVRFFSNPDNLATEVLAAVSVAAAEMIRAEFGKAQAPTQQDKDRLLEQLELLLKAKAPPPRFEKRRQRERVPIPVPERLVRHFHDRTAELSILHLCLANRNLRLVLICGRGGVGKTALTAKLLFELMKDFREAGSQKTDAVDSIVYVPLGEESYRSLDRIVELIARTLDPDAARELHEAWKDHGTPLAERLASVFRGPLAHHRCVVVLDNLESVLDDENRVREEFAALRRFVDACVEYDHGVLVLATSRRALTLSPDAEIAAIGRRVQVSLDEGLPEKYAKALLRELDTDGRLGLRDAPDEVLTMVTRRCGCIPRTLETLVSTLLGRATWNLDTLLANEASFAGLLEKPARQLYESLTSDQDRLVMQALAVYDRPVPSTAIRYILPALPVDDVLSKLVRNFVATHSRGQFWLHPLDRHYAYDRVPEQGSDYARPVMHKLAAEFYEKVSKPIEECRNIEDLEPQLEEFRHLVRAKLHDRACQVLTWIDREYLATWGHSQLIVELRLPLVGHIVDRALTGLNLGNLGAAYFESGDAAKAIVYYEQALAIARELNNRSDEGRWLGNWGLSCANCGDNSKAIDLLTAALVVAREIGDRRHEGRWLGNLIQTRLSAGQISPAQAVEDYQLAITVSREVADHRFVMNWSGNLGSLYMELGEFEKAKQHYVSALTSARRIGARQQTCRLLLRLADAHGGLGETSQQVACCEQTRRELGEISERVDEANVLLKLAALYADLGECAKQLECYDEARQIAEHLGEPEAERRLLLRLGDVWTQLKNKSKAMDCYRRALEKAHEAANRNDEIIALLRLANASSELGHGKEAAEYYEQALKIACEASNRPGEAIILSAWANALLNAGEAREAVRYYELALPIVREMNDKASQSFILNRMGMAAYFLEDVSKAIGYYEQSLVIARALEDRDSESVALFNIGDAHHLANDVAKAIPCYKDALALNMPSTNYKCALGLGVAFRQMGQQQEARSHFEHCIRLLSVIPTTSLAFHPQLAALGVSLLAVGRAEEGLELYRQGLELAPLREYLHYAIQDLRLLQRVPPLVPGVTEAIKLLEGAVSTSTESVT